MDSGKNATRHTNGEADPSGMGTASGRITQETHVEGDVGEDAPKKSKSKGLMLVVAVVALAIGGIVGMRAMVGTSEKGHDGRLDPSSIDPADVNQRADAIKHEIDQAVGELRGDYTKGQVKKLTNPFKGEPNPQPTPPPPPAGPSKFEVAADRLEVSALMGGPKPMAVINRRPRLVGDVVQVALSEPDGTVSFKVKQIGKDSVTVVAEGADPAFEKVLTLQRGR